MTSTLALAAISWCSWVTLTLIKKTDDADVRQIVEKEAPYVADQKALNEAVSELRTSLHQDRLEMKNAVERNTEAINSLRVELAKQR